MNRGSLSDKVLHPCSTLSPHSKGGSPSTGRDRTTVGSLRMCQWLSRPPGERIGQSRTRWIFARRPELRTCSSYKYLDPRVLTGYSSGIHGAHGSSTCFHVLEPSTEASSIPATTWEGFTGTLSKANPATMHGGDEPRRPQSVGGTGRIHNYATGQSSLGTPKARGVRVLQGTHGVL